MSVQVVCELLSTEGSFSVASQSLHTQPHVFNLTHSKLLVSTLHLSFSTLKCRVASSTTPRPNPVMDVMTKLLKSPGYFVSNESCGSFKFA